MEQSALGDWTGAVSDAWTDIIDRIINFIPNIVGAVIVLIIGWIIAILLGRLIEQLLRLVGLQKLFERVKIDDLLKRAEIKADTSSLIGSLVKWIILIVTFIAAADILQLPQVADFLNRILAYIPEVVAAVLILLVGAILAHFLGNVVRAGIQATGLGFAEVTSSVTRYAIIVFSVLAALYQLGIAPGLIQTLFIGLVAMLALAGGLSFGLGGQSLAKDLLDKIKKDLT